MPLKNVTDLRVEWTIYDSCVWTPESKRSTLFTSLHRQYHNKATLPFSFHFIWFDFGSLALGKILTKPFKLPCVHKIPEFFTDRDHTRDCWLIFVKDHVRSEKERVMSVRSRWKYEQTRKRNQDFWQSQVPVMFRCRRGMFHSFLQHCFEAWQNITWT